MSMTIIFVTLISINCCTGKCREASSANEAASDTPENIELFPGNIILSEKKYFETKNDNDFDNVETEEKKNYELRSYSEPFLTYPTEFVDDAEMLSIKISFAEKNALEETVSKQIEDKELKGRITVETEGKTEKSEIITTENRLEESTTLPYSVTVIVSKNAENDSEANPVSNFNDNNNSSLQIDERNGSPDLEIEVIKENSHDLDLNEPLETRRMLGSPDLVLENKARSGEDSAYIQVPEVKIASHPGVDKYNTLNQFGLESKKKLLDHDFVSNQNSGDKLVLEQTATFIETSTPVTGKVSYQKVLNQQTYPKLYSQPDFNTNSNVFHTQLQGLTNSLTYSEMRDDRMHLKQNSLGSQGFQISSEEKLKYHKSAGKENTITYLENKQFEDLNHVKRNNGRHYYHHEVMDSIWPAQNKQVKYLTYNPINQIHHFQQSEGVMDSKGVMNNNNIVNINQDKRKLQQLYQSQAILNSKRFLNNKHIMDNTPRNKNQQASNEEIINLRKTPDSHQINKSLDVEKLQIHKPAIQVLFYPNQDIIQSKLGLKNESLKNVNNDSNKFYQTRDIRNSKRSTENHQFDNVNVKKFINPYTNKYLQGQNIPAVNRPNMPARNYGPNSNYFKIPNLAEALGYPGKLTRNSYGIDDVKIYPHFHIKPNTADSSSNLKYFAEFKDIS